MKQSPFLILLQVCLIAFTVHAQEPVKRDSLKLVWENDMRYLQCGGKSVQVGVFDAIAISPNKQFAAIKSSGYDSEGYASAKIYQSDCSQVSTFKVPPLDKFLINNLGNLALHGCPGPAMANEICYMKLFDKSGNALPANGYQLGNYQLGLSASGKYLVLLAVHEIPPDGSIPDATLLVYNEKFEQVKKHWLRDWGTEVLKPSIDEENKQVILRRYLPKKPKQAETTVIDIRGRRVKTMKWIVETN